MSGKSAKPIRYAQLGIDLGKSMEAMQQMLRQHTDMSEEEIREGTNFSEDPRLQQQMNEMQKFLQGIQQQQEQYNKQQPPHTPVPQTASMAHLNDEQKRALNWWVEKEYRENGFHFETAHGMPQGALSQEIRVAQEEHLAQVRKNEKLGAARRVREREQRAGRPLGNISLSEEDLRKNEWSFPQIISQVAREEMHSAEQAYVSWLHNENGGRRELREVAERAKNAIPSKYDPTGAKFNQWKADRTNFYLGHIAREPNYINDIVREYRRHNNIRGEIKENDNIRLAVENVESVGAAPSVLPQQLTKIDGKKSAAV